MFVKHLEDHGIWYFDHLKLAFFIAREALYVSIMAFIHWLTPVFFETGASKKLDAMMPEYKKRLEKAKAKYIK